MAPTRRPTHFAPPIYRFDEFELQTRPTRLLAKGEPIALQPQPARALELLLQRAGRVVSREQLKTHIWGGESYLDHDQGINFAIRKIRMALDDDATAPRFVETIPRVGYRFLSEVTRVRSEVRQGTVADDRPSGDSAISAAPISAAPISAAPISAAPISAAPITDSPASSPTRARAPGDAPLEAAAVDVLPAATRTVSVLSTTVADAGPEPGPSSANETPPSTQPPGTQPPSTQPPGTQPPGTQPPGTLPPRSRLPSRFVTTVGALVAALIVTWALARPGSDPQTAMPAASEAMLAVAPFDIVGVDTDAAPLAVAVHELLTRRLAMRLDAAPTVLASTSVRQSADSQLSLGADYVLRGRFAQHGDRVHLTLRLEPTSSSQHLWAGTFEPRLAELPAWYDEVARHVAAALQTDAAITTPALGAPLPADDAAALLAAYGRLYDSDTARSQGARPPLEALAARLPDSAFAQAAFAQAALAEARWHRRGDDPRAALRTVETAARQALELNAELASAHLALSYVARLLHHDWDSAEREAQRAVELAPGWHPPLLARAALASSRGRADDARRDLEAARRLDPLGAETRALGIAIDYYAGRWDDAAASARATLRLDPYHRGAHDLLIRSLLAADRRDEALHHLGTTFAVYGQPAPASLDEALARQREAWRAAADAGHPVAAEQALWAALSGDQQAARALLERACLEQPTEALGFAGVEPAFAPLRRRRAWRALTDCLPPPDTPKTAR